MHTTDLHTPPHAPLSHRTRLLLLLLALALYAMAAPRLTVIVAVDGLDHQSLNRLRPYWQQGGLRTLSEEAWQTCVTFPHAVYGGNETLATLLTGTTPANHGISMDNRYRRSDRQVHNSLEDATVNGIGCPLHLSPRGLLTPAIADRMRMQHGAQAGIYAVGIQSEATILLAGHAANACCWLDPEQQRWVTTNYYRDGLPSAADDMNMNGRIAELAARPWTPRMDITAYACPTEQERKKPFNYNTAAVLLNSPTANTLVTEMALALQQSARLGTDRTPDLLLLQMTVLSPTATEDPIVSAEQEDMYLWLNQDLGYLMEQLNRRIGRENYTLLVVGLPRLGIGTATLQQAGMPVRQFRTDRAAALTGTYLMALYGHERWIDGYYGNSLFLNRTLIEQRNLSFETICHQVTAFLLEFEGIQSACTLREAMLAYGPLHQSINKHTAGDVLFTLENGWQLCQDEQTILDHVVEENPKAPVMLWSGSQRVFPAMESDATNIIQLIEN